MRGSNTEIHESLCASRNVVVGTAFMLFCILGAATNFYVRTAPDRGSGVVSLLARAIALIILIQFFIAFKCARERIVIGIVAFRLLTGFLQLVFPQLSLLSLRLPEITLTLWIAGVFISVSMLVSALRQRSP